MENVKRGPCAAAEEDGRTIRIREWKHNDDNQRWCIMNHDGPRVRMQIQQSSERLLAMSDLRVYASDIQRCGRDR